MPATAEVETVSEDTGTIPVITEEMVTAMNIEQQFAVAEDRYRAQIKASEAMLNVEKVKILLGPLMRDAIFTDEEMKALVAMRSVLDQAQVRISDVHHDNVPILDVPSIPQAEGKGFDWNEGDK